MSAGFYSVGRQQEAGVACCQGTEAGDGRDLRAWRLGRCLFVGLKRDAGDLLG
jgi:hypothetical protein